MNIWYKYKKKIFSFLFLFLAGISLFINCPKLIKQFDFLFRKDNPIIETGIASVDPVFDKHRLLIRDYFSPEDTLVYVERPFSSYHTSSRLDYLTLAWEKLPRSIIRTSSLDSQLEEKLLSASGIICDEDFWREKGHAWFDRNGFVVIFQEYQFFLLKKADTLFAYENEVQNQPLWKSVLRESIGLVSVFGIFLMLCFYHSFSFGALWLLGLSFYSAALTLFGVSQNAILFWLYLVAAK